MDRVTVCFVSVQCFCQL